MLTMTSRLALIALLAGYPIASVAQTAAPDPMAPTTEPGLGAPTTTVTPDAQTPKMDAPAGRVEGRVEGQIILQSEDSVLASNLIGSRVYSTTNETVGDINDVIVRLDGSVEGVVIGVGGFLGIGEKDVAVEMDALRVEKDEDGSLRLVLAASREDLDAAPAFKTTLQQGIEAEGGLQVQNPPAADPATPPAAPGANN